MTDRSKKITELANNTAAAAGDYLVIEDVINGTERISVLNLLSNSSVNVTVSNASYLSSFYTINRRSETPANSTVTVTKGTWFFDSDYIYIATANNVLKRVALSVF